MCAIAVLFASVASGASILTPYNVIVSGNFTAMNSDVQGALIAGGTATVSGYSVGQGILTGNSGLGEPAEPLSNFPNNITLYAGTLSGATSVYAGSYNTHGTGSVYPNPGTCCSSTSTVVDVAGDFTAYKNQSSTWHSASANTTYSVSGTTTTIAVSGAGKHIVNVPFADVANGYSVAITGVTDLNYLIVNVTGLVAGGTYTLSGGITIDGYTSNNIAAEDVVFNFYQPSAINLQINSTTIGSVLAPTAAVSPSSQGGGSFSGSLVAASYTDVASGGGIDYIQFHNFTFTSGVPEPAPFAVVGMGLFAFGYIRKRRRA